MKKHPGLINSRSILYSCCIVYMALASCGSSSPDWKEEEAAEDKEIAAYFDTRKPELSTRKNVIDSILGTLKNTDEKLGLENITDPGLKSQLITLSKEKTKIRSSLSPLALTDFFLIYMEKDDELGGYETDFREDLTRQLKQTTYRHNHVNVMLQSTSSEFEYPKVTYENMFAEFLKRKYLVVTDCISYIEPEISDEKTFMEGLVIKKISIYDLQDRSLADEYYLVAESSKSVYVRKVSEDAKPSPGRLKIDLYHNYLDMFNYSLFLKEKLEE